jgi:hypothetical protein
VENNSLDESNWMMKVITLKAGALPGYISRLFNTVRFYYDKDFLIKNAFYKQGIGCIPLKGYNWLNFFLDKIKTGNVCIRRQDCHSIFT